MEFFAFFRHLLIILIAFSLYWPLNVPLAALAYKVRLGTEHGEYLHSMYLDNFAATAGGRELSAYPKVLGAPRLYVEHGTLVGALDFPWRPWGSIELWEQPVTALTRAAGVTSMLITDHPHLFEVGGENYHTDFTAWDYQRGHESDPWKTRPDPSWIGAPSQHRGEMPYDRSRGWFRGEDDFPGPRTMAATKGSGGGLLRPGDNILGISWRNRCSSRAIPADWES